MNGQPTDLYGVLGLAPRASQDEISHAYRALLRRHHPDTRPGEPSLDGSGSDLALQHVIAAYAVLGDPVRRAEYDRQAVPRPVVRRPRRMPTYLPREAPGRPPVVAGPVHWQPLQTGRDSSRGR